MTYHELIALYKTGKLDDTQKRKVEEDIERQDAISEYLFDQEELSAFSDLRKDTKEEEFLEEKDGESERFTRMIQSTIRKTFIKTGVIVGTVVLLIVCFIIFVLPQIVDIFYYDPSEIAGTTEHGETNRISLDLSVYSELFLPGTFRDRVDVIGNGNGKYDITILQSSSMTGVFHNVAGTINKGKMILYDADLLGKPSDNVFCPAEDVVDTWYTGSRGAAGYKNEAFERLGELNDGDYYKAYFTLNQVMGYEDFVKWIQENEVNPEWCVLCQKNPWYDKEIDRAEYFSDKHIGFLYSSSAWSMSYDTDKYPLLTWFSVIETTREEEDWVISEDNMKQHMTSMLRYMADEEDFCKMAGMEYTDSDFNAFADNIEKYGLNLYGFTMIAQKDEILNISELDEIDYVYTEPYR